MLPASKGATVDAASHRRPCTVCCEVQNRLAKCSVPVKKQGVQATIVSGVAALIASAFLPWVPAAHAHIPTGNEFFNNTPQVPSELTGSRDVRKFTSTAARARDAIDRLNTAKQCNDEGRYEQALQQYEFIIQQYPDLALSEYARIGRALLLYQVGRTSDAILELESEEVALTGSAEVHAALAAILYTERPRLMLKAEQEWDVATEFDHRYSDVEWVRTNKHWPERALAALQHFLSLK